MDRVLIVFGAVFGFLGIFAAAAAAHVTGPGSGLDGAANFLLFHAPLLMIVPALIRAGFMHVIVARIGAGFILIGVVLFSGELALRSLEGKTLFSLAAPTGGMLLMVGWLSIAFAVLIAKYDV